MLIPAMGSPYSSLLRFPQANSPRAWYHGEPHMPPREAAVGAATNAVTVSAAITPAAPLPRPRPQLRSRPLPQPRSRPQLHSRG